MCVNQVETRSECVAIPTPLEEVLWAYFICNWWWGWWCGGVVVVGSVRVLWEVLGDCRVDWWGREV